MRGPRKRGFSLIELLIVVAIILTIAAMALPNFNRGRMQANETAAVAAMRSVATSIVGYESTYQTGYPNNLSDLGPPPTGTPASGSAADLIDSLLASGRARDMRSPMWRQTPMAMGETMPTP